MFQQPALIPSAAALFNNNLSISTPKIRLPFWFPLVIFSALILTIDWLLRDVVQLHLGGLTMLVSLGVWWWISKPARLFSTNVPVTLESLQENCRRLLTQFEKIEEGKSLQNEIRHKQLESLCGRHGRQTQELALVGTSKSTLEAYQNLALAVSGSTPIAFHRAHPLSLYDTNWEWPELLHQCDQLIFFLDLPMQAADLRWIENIPSKQQMWLLVNTPNSVDNQQIQQKSAQLRAQLPQKFKDNHCIFWNGSISTLKDTIQDYVIELHSQPGKRIINTEKRLLEELYVKWNEELEGIRNRYFKQLQNRAQWTVAAGVFASPLPSIDLLILAITNGMMIEEMARLWDCPWDFDQLREVATELIKVALSLGVIEWSSQSLISLTKLEGGSWLATSSIQALSAAYLTRVVSRSMADLLIAKAGQFTIKESQELRKDTLVIVAHAIETEKLDWFGFLQNGKQWLKSVYH